MFCRFASIDDLLTKIAEVIPYNPPEDKTQLVVDFYILNKLAIDGTKEGALLTEALATNVAATKKAILSDIKGIIKEVYSSVKTDLETLKKPLLISKDLNNIKQLKSLNDASNKLKTVDNKLFDIKSKPELIKNKLNNALARAFVSLKKGKLLSTDFTNKKEAIDQLSERLINVDKYITNAKTLNDVIVDTDTNTLLEKYSKDKSIVEAFKLTVSKPDIESMLLKASPQLQTTYKSTVEPPGTEEGQVAEPTQPEKTPQESGEVPQEKAAPAAAKVDPNDTAIKARVASKVKDLRSKGIVNIVDNKGNDLISSKGTVSNIELFYDTISRIAPWFMSAVGGSIIVSNARISAPFANNPNFLNWIDGTWHKGIWKLGIWKLGLWKDGIWVGGTWENGEWIKGKVLKDGKLIATEHPPTTVQDSNKENKDTVDKAILLYNMQLTNKIFEKTQAANRGVRSDIESFVKNLPIDAANIEKTLDLKKKLVNIKNYSIFRNFIEFDDFIKNNVLPGKQAPLPIAASFNSYRNLNGMINA